MTDLRFDTVGIAGDWHGNYSWVSAALKEFAVNNINVILHLGDFGVGLGPYADSYINRVSNRLNEFGQVIVITLGNHENYETVAAAPIVQDGVFVGMSQLAENIFVAQRGQRWVWEDRKFVSLGGANSIDRSWRVPRISWWEEEQISMGDVYRTMEGGKADIMLAHDAPTGIVKYENGETWPKEAVTYAEGSSEMLRYAMDAVQPRLYFHGHHHQFYQKMVEAYAGGTDKGYVTRFIGLDRDNHNPNIGTLTLKNLKFDTLVVNDQFDPNNPNW